jgi:hypothetical protein
MDAESGFDMSAVEIPDFGLFPHAVSEKYRSEVSLILSPFKVTESGLLQLGYGTSFMEEAVELGLVDGTSEVRAHNI